jgi:hypothetical protein
MDQFARGYTEVTDWAPIELLIFFACWLAFAIVGAFLLVVGLERLEAKYSYLDQIKAAFATYRKRNADKRIAKRTE